jgi:hypothetical protein
MRIGEICDLEDLRAPNWLKRTAFNIRSDPGPGCRACCAPYSLPALACPARAQRTPPKG